MNEEDTTTKKPPKKRKFVDIIYLNDLPTEHVVKTLAQKVHLFNSSAEKVSTLNSGS